MLPNKNFDVTKSTTRYQIGQDSSLVRVTRCRPRETQPRGTKSHTSFRLLATSSRSISTRQEISIRAHLSILQNLNFNVSTNSLERQTLWWFRISSNSSSKVMKPGQGKTLVRKITLWLIISSWRPEISKVFPKASPILVRGPILSKEICH